MKLILAGGPGSGKGEAAKYLRETYPIHYIGMGDLVRSQIKQKTPCGQMAEKYVVKGKLLPNYIADAIWVMASNKMENWLADGYPRSIGQVRFFVRRKYDFDLLLHLNVSQRIMRQRMLGRGRTDDVKRVIENRIKAYIQQTLPAVMLVKERYPEKYVKIDARGSILDTNENILIALTQHGKGMLA